MSKGYSGGNKVTINNVTELNLIVEALQTQMASYIKAAQVAGQRSQTLSRTLTLKASATSKLLDRLRVGWKAADNIPAEIQEQLAAREDRRFWSNIQTRMEEIDLELAAGVEYDPTAENLYMVPC